jgi:hypothetical protein
MRCRRFHSLEATAPELNGLIVAGQETFPRFDEASEAKRTSAAETLPNRARNLAQFSLILSTRETFGKPSLTSIHNQRA